MGKFEAQKLPDRPSVTLRWERGFGLCVRTRLPGEVLGDVKVSVWSALPQMVREVRWLREAIRSGEVVLLEQDGRSR